jgi:hypothetical protein
MDYGGNGGRTVPPIWDKILKYDSRWLLEMVELQEIKPSVLPTLVGWGLKDMYKKQKDSAPLYLVLLAQDWSGDLRYAGDMLLESLQSYKWVSDGEVSIVGTRIIVNISECLGNSTAAGQILLQKPSRIFGPEKARRTKILYYGDAEIRDVGPEHIGGQCKRFSTSVKNMCLVRMKAGDGKAMYRVFVRDGWTPPVHGIAITDGGGRRWTTNWK